MTEDLIRYCSIDIGKKNFSFYVEEFDRKELLQIKNIPVKTRYNPNGTPTKKMQEILDQVFSNGRTILHKNLDLTKNCDKKLRLDPETFHNMNDVLDEYTDHWDQCSAFVIEQQLKRNPMAVKLGQHCYSYFTFKYGRFKQIIEYPSYHKTQILGAPKVIGKPYKSGKTRWKSMSKPQRKKWAVEKTIEVLTCRGEMDVLEGLTTVSKKDDLADCFLQLKSAQYKIFVDKSL